MKRKFINPGDEVGAILQPKEIAQSLRAMRKATIHAYSVESQQVLAIHGFAERLDVLLAAADELERPSKEEMGALQLVADIRAALGDPEGRLMQDKLIQRARNAMAVQEHYRATVEKRPPKWVPCRVLLPKAVRGDPPIGQSTVAEAGAHDCESNQWGAISVLATNGARLGIKPAEFEVLEWRENGP